eukprot:13112725-Alexandrium_andersonii.AAC.1
MLVGTATRLLYSAPPTGCPFAEHPWAWVSCTLAAPLGMGDSPLVGQPVLQRAHCAEHPGT